MATPSNEMFALNYWQGLLAESVEKFNQEANNLLEGTEMKSDLVGRVAVKDLQTGQVYIDRKRGLVVLTNDKQANIAAVVHTTTSKFKMGEHVRLYDDGKESHLERLGGKIILSN